MFRTHPFLLGFAPVAIVHSIMTGVVQGQDNARTPAFIGEAIKRGMPVTEFLRIITHMHIVSAEFFSLVSKPKFEKFTKDIGQ